MSNSIRLITGSLLAVISTASFLVALQDEPNLELTVLPTVHDFGKVQQGDILRHVLSITNDTEKTIRLGKSLGSCRCVVTDQLQGKVIETGATIRVPIAWDIRGKRGHATADMVFNYHASPVNTTSPHLEGRNFFAVFRAYADVVPEYYVSPEKIEFEYGANNDETILQIKRHAESKIKKQDELELIDFGANSEAISLEKIESPANNIATLRVRIDSAKLWSGLNHLSELHVELLLDSKYEPLFKVPVILVKSNDL